jgi:hypothetical protein
MLLSCKEDFEYHNISFLIEEHCCNEQIEIKFIYSGKCTTDGTTCVARAACTTYNSEAACQVGSDGIPCTYNYPVGTTTGTKSCRAKECADIKGTSNDQCIG